ncbi:YfiR/HmsC family protein [Algibacillus agarilyticus]|uniref:YfiR/HmsC family protein n=1 Tax=Algibacillus agarilyticus TaxID=2234133 RepID=UPI000DCFA296|nr:YfiR/HmsC family protein [Algibacillus agarilyticus]
MLPSVLHPINISVERRLLALCLIFFTCKLTAVELPDDLQAVLLSKLLPYEQSIVQQSQDLNIFIINSPGIFQAFSRLKTNSNIKFSKIKQGDTLPEEHYQLIYLNDEKNLAGAMQYAREHNAIIATGQVELVKKGATIGTGTEKGKPKFYLNLSSSFAAKLHWDPKVLKIVKTYP